ncbi:uncharacterized protein RJT20DRAFT_55315 [Scheffersomyces xylosifermentans]|uniref:uncharacterized protein n=1 Tax=Scheffersomyces xylosifermentans TaxID=1304137 RepID=UPI00315DB5E1
MSAKQATESGFKKFKDFLFSKQSLRYMCTTHFWGPVSNFGIPVAAILDLKKEPDLISGPMTGSLIMYSLVFMRYSLAVTPQNYLLFGCHFVNEIAQLGQGFRWAKHHYVDTPKKEIEPVPEAST